MSVDYGYVGGSSADGQSKAKIALICGIIGLFLFGIILGPIAIVQANKAEALGTKATGEGPVDDTIFGLIGTFIIMNYAVAGSSIEEFPVSLNSRFNSSRSRSYS
jgi:hypothetical protein